MPDWPHSPPHRLIEQGAYMITSGIYRKAHLLNTAERLDIFSRLFFACMHESGWELHAWAMLSNHYHFIASSQSDPSTLRRTISKLHTLSAKELNIQDGRPGRKVWFQYFDAHITFINSYLPRLKYVHNNPVHHGVVVCAENYKWCSAAWFARNAPSAFQQTVQSFNTDNLSVPDSFEVRSPMLVNGSESGVKPPHSKFSTGESGVEPPHSTFLPP